MDALMKLQPDRQWFRSANGKHLLAGSPLMSFAVTDAGARILDVIEKGSSLPDGHESLTRRLLATGSAHPVSVTPANSQDITVVIPAFVRNDAEREQLELITQALHGLKIVIVDDHSPQELHIPGVHIIRNSENQGPANSRNTGLDHVETKYVAFVDVDTVVTSSQLQELAGYLADEQLSFVAPRMKTEPLDDFIHEYESVHSPLDLGDAPALVRPLSRVSYVPTAVLVARTESVLQLGAFDDSMRQGEDVDLIWRAVESGNMCRYVPSIECQHQPRQTIRALLKQRFGYGSSAAFLDKRHPFTASPLRTHLFLLLPALALISGNLFSFFLLLPCAVIYFLITLRSTRLSLPDRLRVIFLGFRSTLSLTAQAITRAWWPLFLIAGFFNVYPAAMLTFSVLVPPIFGLMRRKSSYPLRYIAVRSLENAMYGLGVWKSVIQTRNVRCLVPVITIRKTQKRHS